MSGGSLKRIANGVGARWLSFQNPRVVCPPGRIAANGRRNVMVATPMRCGTHVMIDALLNNLPAYRRAPLYVDLDQFLKQGVRPDADFGALGADAGYVLKTHFPLGMPDPAAHADAVAALARDALVITVRRDPEQIRASLSRWSDQAQGAAALDRHLAELDANLAAFRAFWDGRADIALDFGDLFDPARMQAVLAQAAQATGARAASRYRHAPPKRGIRRIYLQKALTRLAGRRAPRINTTIHVS